MLTDTVTAGYFKGTFVTGASLLEQKLQHIKAFIFDWDGVFNNGHKNTDGNSSFSETDAMGINLVRFNHHLRKKEQPVAAVITGENNQTAFTFAKREHFNAVYYSIKNKETALQHLCKQFDLRPSEVLFVFDDVLDLSAAKLAGLRIMINRSCNPLLIKFATDQHLVDYLTDHDGNHGAVREAAELILSLSHRFDDTVENRMLNSTAYQQYIGQRNKITTQFYTIRNNEIAQQDPV